MGTASNFGNMISISIASIFLTVLPMLPTQILLINLMYDLSQTPIPTDNVDAEYIKKQKRFDMKSIRRFMLFFGPVGILWDLATFLVMIVLFKSSFPEFRTAWFIESITTQFLIIFVIRTRKVPFWKSKPGKFVVITSIALVLAALIIPYTYLGEIFQFEPVPPLFYLFMVGMLLVYFAITELQKKWFFKKYDI